MEYHLNEAARRYAVEHETALVELIEALSAIPAPSHHEERRAAFVKAWFEENGFSGVTIDAAKNVIAPVNCTPGCEVVVFMAHTDTVFPDMEPMPLRREGDRLCCPGVGDDTANLAALMLAARYFRAEPQTADCGFLFVANSCEEGLGNLKGCRQLMQDYAGRVREVISFDGGLGGICNKAVGSARYRVTVRTEGGHSFGAFGNRNAIHLLSSMIGTLYAVKPPVEGDSKTTYNVGKIEGGTSVNTIAQEASMLYEYRSDSRACMAQMQAMFESVIAAYRSMGIEVEVELLGERLERIAAATRIARHRVALNLERSLRAVRASSATGRIANGVIALGSGLLTSRRLARELPLIDPRGILRGSVRSTVSAERSSAHRRNSGSNHDLLHVVLLSFS